MPSHSKHETRKLLETLRQKRDRDRFSTAFPQNIEPPDEIDDGIPTLQTGVYRPPTPMIADRFRFAGRWENAQVGLTWLSLRDMQSAWIDDSIRETLAVLRMHWQDSAPALHDDAELSLFAWEPEQRDHVYFVWRSTAATEPRVAWYRAQREDTYDNLDAFLRFLVGKRSK